MPIRSYLSVICILLTMSSAHAQLSFPRGTELDLTTTEKLMYFETEILFHTGAYKITEYAFEKISDSVDSHWLVDMCINGDCRNGTPQTGNFTPDFGFNDTTGFIRFHVFTQDFDGRSVVKYRVLNTKNAADKADLTFKITFNKFSGIASLPDMGLVEVYPNPVRETLVIKLTNTACSNPSVTVKDMEGRDVMSSVMVTGSKGPNQNGTQTFHFDMKEHPLTKGMYMVHIDDGKYHLTKKVVIN